MKAITLWQPYASLVALGVKTIETRSWPAPKGLVGQRIAIHAAAKPPIAHELDYIGDWMVLPAPDDKRSWFMRHWPTASEATEGERLVDALWPDTPEARERGCVMLPLGAVVASAVLADCVPMVTDDDMRPELGRYLWLNGYSGPHGRAVIYPDNVDVSAQLPFGDFAPGRWAWLLDDIAPTTTRCPRCDLDVFDDAYGEGYISDPSACGDPDHCSPQRTCPVCGGEGSCGPIPAKGAQRVWNWQPTG